MTYENIVNKVQKQAIKCNVAPIDHHIAVQFNILGEGEGAFYVEIAAGRILVQPYEYSDRDAVIYVDAETLFDVFAGTISISDVTSNGRLVVQGNYDATINLLEALVDQTQEDK